MRLVLAPALGLVIAGTLALGCGGRSRLPLPAPPTALSATPEEAFLAPPAGGAVTLPPATPTTEEATLENGMRVIVVRVPALPTVSVMYASRASTSVARDVPAGVDTLLTWMLDALMPTQDVTIGSSGVWMSSDGLAGELGSLVSSAATLARLETVDAAAVRAERDRLAGEVVDASRSWYVRVYQVREQRLIYGDRDPRAQPWYGTLERFRRLDADDVMARHHQLFAADASAIVVVGDVDFDTVLGHIRAAFGDWTTHAAPYDALPPAAFPRPGGRLVVFPAGGPATIAVRERAPHRLHEDRAAFEVATALLGGMFGSRINHVLREERGHTYGVHASLDDSRDYAILTIDLAVPTEHVRGTVFEIIHEMERLQDPDRIEEDELASARATAMAGYRRWFGTPSSIAATFAYFFLLGETGASWLARTAAIAEIDAEDVARVARAWLRPDAAPILVSCGYLEALNLETFVPGGTELVLDR